MSGALFASAGTRYNACDFRRHSRETAPNYRFGSSSDAAELVEELKGRPVEDSDSQAQANPIERAFFACRKRKWNADNGHDKRHQRKGQFSIQVDHQRADCRTRSVLDP